MSKPRSIYVVDGPDGAGKTTLIDQLKRSWDKKSLPEVVHHGSYKHIKQGLGRLYIESMLPALLGYNDVILDRSWLSELPYGRAFRNGADRLGPVGRRMIERVALRCRSGVILCLPPVDTCLEAFKNRLGEEYLDTEDELREVHRIFTVFATSDVPQRWYDYTNNKTDIRYLDIPTSVAHPLNSRSGGNYTANIIIVGDEFAEAKEHDPLFRVPFVSFSKQGCSWWLTEQLDNAGVKESDLCWVNSDDPLLHRVVTDRCRQHVFVLGDKAEDRVMGLKLKKNFTVVNHPQHAKRFQHKEPYRLISLLQEALK